LREFSEIKRGSSPALTSKLQQYRQIPVWAEAKKRQKRLAFCLNLFKKVEEQK
jgi:hypothetical protein